jgi:biopolymer transport protein TolR
MAATSESDDDEMISGINVTPLVDITLVLLIIFMVTATYIVRQSLEVTLPRAAHGGETVGTTLMLIVRQDGSFVLDGATVDDAQLRERARAARAKDPDVKAIVAADKDARHGAVVHLIDVVKGEGVSKFALNIEREETEVGAVAPGGP